MQTTTETQNTANTFDFWIGEWDAWWSNMPQGTNTITKILNDQIVEESFSYNNGSFNGRSWTVFDNTNKIWKQTWVDDQGDYLLFTGGQVDNTIVLTLTGKTTRDGQSVSMRMVFYNITPDSFDWDWQSSTDDKKWRSVWLIKYKRRKK